MQVSEQKKIIVFGDLQISLDCLVSENVIRWMPQGVIDNKLTLVQVMAWCSQASTGLIALSCCSDSGIVTNVSSYHNNVSAEWYGYVFPLWCYKKTGIKGVGYSFGCTERK